MRLLTAAALLATSANTVLCYAQSVLQVWSKMKNGPPLTPEIQQRFDISRSTLSVGSSLQIIVNASCYVLYTDRERPWMTQRVGGALRFPCCQGISDPHIAYYESGIGHPRWFLSGFYAPTGNAVLDAQCVNATLQTYEIDGATCGTGDWLQHAFNPPFAQFTKRVGYFTRFATATGPVLLGGVNFTSGEALTDVWANCRSFFDCPQLGWRRGDDVPEGCASAEHAFLAFSVDDVVYIACGGSGPSPGELSVYFLRHPGLKWIRYTTIPAGVFSMPLALVNIEQVR